jgi:hypothetical protein
MTVPVENTDPRVYGVVSGEELTKRAQQLLELSVQVPEISPVERSGGEVDRWLYNTWIRDITNLTSGQVRVRNPENEQRRDISPGGTATVNWASPWVDNPTEFSVKSLTFRTRPPGADPTNPGTLIFRVFLDFDVEIVSWVPAGADHTMRNPIELTPGGGVFLGRVREIDLTVNAVPIPNPPPPPAPPPPPRIVPGASVTLAA